MRSWHKRSRGWSIHKLRIACSNATMRVSSVCVCVCVKENYCTGRHLTLHTFVHCEVSTPIDFQGHGIKGHWGNSLKSLWSSSEPTGFLSFKLQFNGEKSHGFRRYPKVRVKWNRTTGGRRTLHTCASWHVVISCWFARSGVKWVDICKIPLWVIMSSTICWYSLVNKCD